MCVSHSELVSRLRIDWNMILNSIFSGLCKSDCVRWKCAVFIGSIVMIECEKVFFVEMNSTFFGVNTVQCSGHWVRSLHRSNLLRRIHSLHVVCMQRDECYSDKLRECDDVSCENKQNINRYKQIWFLTTKLNAFNRFQFFLHFS